MKKIIYLIVVFFLMGSCKVYTCPTYANNSELKLKNQKILYNMEEEIKDKVQDMPQPEGKDITLAQRVAEVEQEIAQAMIEAIAPILERTGFSGFKDIQLLTTKPDEEGKIQQTIKVIL